MNTMPGFQPENLTALEFARQHDWGRNATLSDDGTHIEGLIEAYTLSGEYHAVTTSVPATIRALRKFGDY